MRFAVAAAVLAAPSIAAAHITLNDPPPRTLMEKNQHCGDASPRQAKPKVVKPGSKYTVVWTETIDHPGHFRISFSMNNGTDFVIPPTSTGTTEGMPTVLVDLIPDVQGNFPAGGRKYSKEITLPNVECSNCTLQVIQLMTDKPPYTTDVNSDDVYFQCADFILTNNAPAPDAGVGGDAGTGGSDSGGCSTTGSGGSIVVAGALLAALSRRRRLRG